MSDQSVSIWILAFRYTLRHQCLARRGQIAKFWVDIEFLKMADDNDHGIFRAMRVDELKKFLNTTEHSMFRKEKGRIGWFGSWAEGKYKPLEACDHEE